MLLSEWEEMEEEVEDVAEGGVLPFERFVDVDSKEVDEEFLDDIDDDGELANLVLFGDVEDGAVVCDDGNVDDVDWE